MKIAKLLLASTAIGLSTNSFAEGIDWNGFGSLYYSQAMDNQMLINGHSNNRPDFTTHSLFGFNAGAKLADNISVASQIVMVGKAAQQENFNVYAQWAYVNWKPTNGASVKIGRQLFPALISSEYQRVHFLLPQSNIPSTTYRILPFVSMDGASATQAFDVGVGKLSLGAYVANPKLNTQDPDGVKFGFDRVVGFRATLEGSGWTVHGTANRLNSNISVTGKHPVVGDFSGKAATRTNIFTFGYRFDKSDFVSWGEVIYTKAIDDAMLKITNTAGNVTISNKQFLKDSYAGYVLMGYRFGKFLPSITYSQGTTDYGLPTGSDNASYQGRVETYIAGLSYQANDQLMVRGEFARSYVPSLRGGFYDVIQGPTSTKKYGDAVKMGIDFIF